jgi:hypothetical protein
MKLSFLWLGLLATLPLSGCGVIHAGGSGDDAATAVTVHRSATYVAGYFEGQAQFGSIVKNGAGRDWFVGRLKDNDWDWVTGSGTSGLDQPLGIDVDRGGTNVYVVGHHAGAGRIERFAASNGAFLSGQTFGDCTEFAAVAAGEDAVYAACNHEADSWTGIVVYTPSLTSPRFFVLRDDNGDRSRARIRALRLSSLGLFVYGDFSDRIQVTRLRPLGSSEQLLLVAQAQRDVFLLRLDAGELIDGRLLAKSGRQIGGLPDEVAADFALGQGDIFVALGIEDDLVLETGRELRAVCPGAGPDFNFAVLRLDGGLRPGAAVPENRDGNNAPLDTVWGVTYGNCEGGVSAEALDHSGRSLLLAGTYGREFRTGTDTLVSRGGLDAFALYLDDSDGGENAAISGGGEGDEQVFDDVQGGISRGWVVGSYNGEQPTFPLVKYDEESLLRGTEETLPPTGSDEVMVWRMPF